MSPTNLVGLLPSELEDLAVELGASRYRGRQLATWIYRKNVVDLESMTDLAKDFKAALSERAVATLPDVERVTPSQDGSRKLVLRLSDGGRVSAVLMPDEDRITLCLSTQVGCGYGCAFCLTGTMGLGRNLTAGEIVGQTMIANRILEEHRVTHLVYMGMGEPLANYEAVVTSLRILTDAKLGLGYSPRRITVSTVGLVPGIRRLAGERLPVSLAVSLHAANDALRDHLVPVNRRYPLAVLGAACREYTEATGRRLSFEWAMIAGVNDRPSDAAELAAIARPLHAHVNLIPLNPTPGYATRGTPAAGVRAFRDRLAALGVNATVRDNRGTNIDAACGQLAARAGAAPPQLVSAGATRESPYHVHQRS